jgi:RimJ/RimL family protein N-acetyltransferase
MTVFWRRFARKVAPMALEPVTLSGRHVELVPLSRDHHDALIEAVRDGELWRLWYTAIPAPKEMAAEIDRRLGLQAAGSMLPFTVLDGPGGRVVGMTTYMNISLDAPRVEIGSTWYARRVQRSPLNTEAKLLLLSHAFDRLGCLAVELRTHFMNHQSRRAIERLGARLDGVLRHHQRMRDGTLRDTCVYSIIAPDWPAVRTHLGWQLEQPRHPGPGPGR